MWWWDDTLMPDLEPWWKESKKFNGTLDFLFLWKLSFMKSKLKEWNASNFQNIFVEKVRVEGELERLNERIIAFGIEDHEFKDEKSLKSELSKLLARVENYWKDKARESWLREGDLDTGYFHASVKSCRNMNEIDRVRNNMGDWCIEEDEIGAEAVKFFELVLCNAILKDNLEQNRVLEEILELVSNMDNEILNAIFSREEIKEAVFQLHPNKDSGPDGFQTGFYQRCWDFMGEDIFKLVEDIRARKNVLRT
ncbi:uncharacterized protein LOC131063529 [Cryptomeria japonica]|uniref:uncharacterized protein LOC131063529 n=1 Tax=Cryptomeria japonica TaxID=3369 RepID=UPI0025ACF115|nr:uncharacterized protein LOC131063529 [Cryptomeria japonica]